MDLRHVYLFGTDFLLNLQWEIFVVFKESGTGVEQGLSTTLYLDEEFPKPDGFVFDVKNPYIFSIMVCPASSRL